MISDTTTHQKYKILEKVTRFTGFAGGKVIKAIHLTLILSSSTIDKKLENFEFKFEFKIAINFEILVNFEFNFEIFVNFEFIFQFFLSISSFLSMAHEVTIRKTNPE